MNPVHNSDGALTREQLKLEMQNSSLFTIFLTAVGVSALAPAHRIHDPALSRLGYEINTPLIIIDAKSPFLQEDFFKFSIRAQNMTKHLIGSWSSDIIGMEYEMIDGIIKNNPQLHTVEDVIAEWGFGIDRNPDAAHFGWSASFDSVTGLLNVRLEHEMIDRFIRNNPKLPTGDEIFAKWNFEIE